MTTLTANQQSFIEMMKANEEMAWKGFQFLLERSDYPRFFDMLKGAGFFEPQKNPAPVRGERENTVRIPFWAPLDYLKAVAKKSGDENDMVLAEKVMTVVREVSAWRDEKGEPRFNYHTDRTFAEILGLLPTQAVNLSDVDLVGHWLNNAYDQTLMLHALDDRAIPRFLGSMNPEDWGKAARLLYNVTAIVWRKNGVEREPEPVCIADDFWLGDLLKHRAKEIGRKTGEKAAEIMLDRVREVFRTPTRRDFSDLFRPAVEDDAQNYQFRSAENRVVEGLRDVLLGWLDEDIKNAQVVIIRMLDDDLQIIRRIGVYVVAQRWESLRGLYGEIFSPTLFRGHMHELYQLLRINFSAMNEREQAQTLRAIEELPEPSDGDDPESLRRYSQYRWLSALTGKGCARADRWFAELDADPKVGKLTSHPEFNSYSSFSWSGPGPTPYSSDDLAVLTQAKVIAEKLNTFAPSNDWQGPSTDGLSGALDHAARTKPDVFLANLPQFVSVRPIYQHAVINGLKGAWEAQTEANWGRGWEHLVSFFEQLVNDQNFWKQADDTYQHWVVRAIADCLRAGTKEDAHAYDPRLLPRTQNVIAALLEHEPGAATADDDAMFQALNTPKGRVIEALYNQALRAARVADNEHGSHGDSWKEISHLFETELAKCKGANYELSTLCGTYLPQLQYLDSEWANRWVEHIFPAEYEANTVCALDGLGYASFTRPVYELVAEHGIIDRALALELKGRGGREKLLERVGAAYLWGLERLDEERLTRLLGTATAEDLEVLTRLFWMARDGNLTSEQRERILAFWDRSLESVQRQSQTSSRSLSSMSLLAVYITTLGDRERRLLESVAPHVHSGHETYEFTAQLRRLAEQNPEAVTKILESMVGARVPDYDYEGRLSSLFEYLAEHGQKDAAIRLSDRLRHLPGIEKIFKKLIRY